MKKVYPASWYYQREIFRMISRFIGCLLVVVGLWYLICAMILILG